VRVAQGRLSAWLAGGSEITALPTVRGISGNTIPTRAAPPAGQGDGVGGGGKVAERTSRASTQSLEKASGQLIPSRTAGWPVAAVSS
jgi:hypothetical protein